MTAPRLRNGGYWPVFLTGFLIIFLFDNTRAEDAGNPFVPGVHEDLAAVLPPQTWKQVESSVDRALAWVSTQQQADGSFPTYQSGQPAITSLCVLAFLSRGYQPGNGPYGQQLNRAIDFVVGCQMEDGLFSYEKPQPFYVRKGASHAAVYNHAIAGLMLGEVYGHVTGTRAKAVKHSIDKALQFTRELQTRPKPSPYDSGGWRYLPNKGGGEPDSDLSCTAWQLMFLRSARNAEFAVPQHFVDDAVAYVKRCWNPEEGMFAYARDAEGNYWQSSRGMTAAGILSLSLAGQHQTQIAQAAGQWLVQHPYTVAGEHTGGQDRYFYSAYYCSQAAMQLGGRYWAGIYPPLVRTMLGAQLADGSWPVETTSGDAIFGKLYTTSLAILSLTPPYQLLPVYQK
jgi:hypothetical protein